MNEEQRPIKGYEGYYNITRSGRIFSLERVIIRRDGLPRKVSAKEVFPCMIGEDKKYPIIPLSKNGKIELYPLKVAIAEAFADYDITKEKIVLKNDSEEISLKNIKVRPKVSRYGGKVKVIFDNKTLEFNTLGLACTKLFHVSADTFLNEFISKTFKRKRKKKYLIEFEKQFIYKNKKISKIRI